LPKSSEKNDDPYGLSSQILPYLAAGGSLSSVATLVAETRLANTKYYVAAPFWPYFLTKSGKFSGFQGPESRNFILAPLDLGCGF
jgi:hypothetical protein